MNNRKLSAAVIISGLLLVNALVTASTEPAPEEAAYVQDEVLVRFRDDADELSRKRIRGSVNGLASRKFRHTGIEKILIGPGRSVEQAIELLEEDPHVEFAEPNWQVRFQGMPYLASDDPGFTSGDQWHLNTSPFIDNFLPPDITTTVDVDIDAPEAWGVMQSVFNSGMTAAVGVLDTGCGESGYFSPSTGYVPGHIDLPNSVLFANTQELSVIGSDSPADANSLVDDVNGWDMEDNDNTPADEPDIYDPIPRHGTRVSGIIGADWSNGVDVAGIGMDHVKVLPLRTGDVDDILEGIEYAIGMVHSGKPVRVLNASWHISHPSNSLRIAIEQAGEEGIALAAAAGNRGQNNDDNILNVYPAEYTKIPLTNVLAVAATGTDGTLAEFSNYGEGSVQIAAPGVNIYSTGGDTTGYMAASGTSFSSPIAAAALGLLFAAHPGMSPEGAIGRLISGGDFDARLAGWVSSGKRVNLAGALAPFHPYSGLAPLDGFTKPVFMYTDSISRTFGTITRALSSDDSVAVMVTDAPGSWAVSPVSPGTASFTLSFGGLSALVGSYETGPWRVTAISPFFMTVQTGQTSDEPFRSCLPGSVSWEVMDPSIGSVDEDGWFTGKSPGSTRVILYIDGTPVDSSGAIRVLRSYTPEGPTDCFIATAAFGSVLEPHVGILRDFRDRYLLTNRPGRAFVSFYYRHSPPLAEFIASSGMLKCITRAVLLPVIAVCWAILTFGPIPTVLILLGVPCLSAAAVKVRRRG